ncbi:MAG: hypothetical protein OEY72_08755, partial [Gammaproteobacteria bacterium]|nr:hypothetical protein [Gammaproteobacteria bacterium]
GLAYPVMHRIGVIAAVFGLIGLLWALPVPDEFLAISPLLNWGTTFLMAAVVYYFVIATSLAIGILPFALGLTACALWLDNSAWSLELGAGAALLVGIASLFFGRGSGGAALMSDIQLMMIGPVWQLSRLYRRLGIPY